MEQRQQDVYNTHAVEGQEQEKKRESYGREGPSGRGPCPLRCQEKDNPLYSHDDQGCDNIADAINIIAHLIHLRHARYAAPVVGLVGVHTIPRSQSAL